MTCSHALEAVAQLGGVIEIILSSKTWGKELEEKLLLLKPNIDGALQIISSSYSSTHKHRQFKEFQSVLEDGLKLVQEVDNLHIFDIYRKWLYGRKI